MTSIKVSTSSCGCVVCRDPYNPKYPAKDFLLCKRALVHLGYGGSSEVERQWWANFEPHARPWIEQAIQSNEITSPLEAWHGGYILIAEGLDSFGGTMDWKDFNGHMLLFEGLGHGGMLEGWSAAAIIHGMSSFMEYLMRQKVVKPHIGKHICREIERWKPSIVSFLEEDGPWLKRDDVPISSARVECNGSF